MQAQTTKLEAAPIFTKWYRFIYKAHSI